MSTPTPPSIDSLTRQIAALSEANDVLRDENLRARTREDTYTDLLHRSYLVVRDLVGDNAEESVVIGLLKSDLERTLGIRR